MPTSIMEMFISQLVISIGRFFSAYRMVRVVLMAIITGWSAGLCCGGVFAEAPPESAEWQVADTINDPPVITGQTVLSTPEDQAITIAFEHLIVSDPDNVYPNGFTIIAGEGPNYTLSGLTIIPTPDFSGPLTVPVSVNDGTNTSAPFPLQINVVPVNDPPVITGQAPLSTAEETALIIAPSHLTVTDPDNTYPAGFTLQLAAGDNYTVSGTTVTPGKDFVGTLSVPVVVNDGGLNSDPFDLIVSVTNVNDAPVITGQLPLSTSENKPVAIELSHLVIEDPDNDSFTLSIIAGQNYSVSGNVVTPSPGFSGNLTVPVIVSDGTLNSNQFNFVISVSDVNDPPVISGQRPLQIAEDTSIGLSLADITVIDPDNTFPTGFTLFVLPGAGYTFSGTQVTPAANFSGPLNVNIMVNDGTSNSPVFPLMITVTPVNDAPVITGQREISTQEETARVIAFADLTVSDPDNTYPHGFTMLILAGPNYTVENDAVIPTNDFNGTLTVSVQVSDGDLSSNVFPLKVVVTPVNDKPVIIGQLPLQTSENTPVTIQLAHLTVQDADNDYPTGFSLSVSSGTNYSVSGATVQPAPGFIGTLNIPVSVSDGTTSSDVFLFQVQVGAGNAPPVITGQFPVNTNEDEPVTLELAHLTVTDPDNAYPGDFTLEVSPGDNYTISGTTITPDPDFAGVLAVPVRVNDGINNSQTFSLQVSVNEVNDPPMVILARDTLLYEIEEGPAVVAALLDIEDADDDSLSRATVAFTSSTYRRNIDLLEFEPTTNISGIFNDERGALELTGIASINEYRMALRSITYTHLNSVDPIVERKEVQFVVSDGVDESETATKFIVLQYFFVEFEIPSAFTPNGDMANDVWVIERPGGSLEELDNAVISVYNRHGVLVYRARGFDQHWDGKLDGEYLPADVYFFTIDLGLRNNKVYKGTVIILR